MKILLVTDTLLPGGAELFVLRLAQSLFLKGHDVRIFNLTPNAISTEQVKLICPQVPIISPAIRNIYSVKKIDSLLYRTGVDFSILRKLQQNALESYCRKEKFDVVHSHLFTSDLVTVAATRSLNTKIVITIHGDYMQYPKKLDNKEHIWLLNYSKKLRHILKHVHDIVVITDEQKEFFQLLVEREKTNNRIHKIYNGYLPVRQGSKNLKLQLDIKANDFVFGMVARGIEEKGWNYLIEAFNLLEETRAHLVLVGSGGYLNKLREQNDNPRIHFTGFTATPLEWVDILDVGLFASYIQNEGLPTTLIEYLFLDKPIITTNVGECKKMITKDGKSAGIAVDLKNGKPDAELIAAKMKILMRDKQLLNSFKQVAGLIKPNFDMENCVDNYLNVYRE